MTLRLVFGLGWSLTIGLAGGWLALAPWALGQQGGGEWTAATKNEVVSGLALVALALAGVVLVAVQVVRSLREAGVVEPDRRTAAGVTSSPEMEAALIALARALAEDLEADREPAAAGRQPVSPRPREPS